MSESCRGIGRLEREAWRESRSVRKAFGWRVVCRVQGSAEITRGYLQRDTGHLQGCNRRDVAVTATRILHRYGELPYGGNSRRKRGRVPTSCLRRKARREPSLRFPAAGVCLESAQRSSLNGLARTVGNHSEVYRTLAGNTATRRCVDGGRKGGDRVYYASENDHHRDGHPNPNLLGQLIRFVLPSCASFLQIFNSSVSS